MLSDGMSAPADTAPDRPDLFWPGPALQSGRAGLAGEGFGERGTLHTPSLPQGVGDSRFRAIKPVGVSSGNPISKRGRFPSVHLLRKVQTNVRRTKAIVKMTRHLSAQPLQTFNTNVRGAKARARF